MPHINLPENIPGIRSLALFRPDTAKHLYDLAQILLRGDSPLSSAERELIASYVSSRNNCAFCMESHAAAARELFGDEREVVDCVIGDVATAPVSVKMKALLKIAGAVQTSGRLVAPEHVQEARLAGAGDRDIHDTVLIAATFSMFNRYVDGLATLTPGDPAEYEAMGKRLATVGYAPPVNSKQ
jgi:uncharacterized peroxidase-related enzyme